MEDYFESLQGKEDHTMVYQSQLGAVTTNNKLQYKYYL